MLIVPVIGEWYYSFIVLMLGGPLWLLSQLCLIIVPNYFDWYIKLHLYSEEFPEQTDTWIEEKASKADFKIFAIDDQTVVQIIDDNVEVISVCK